MLMDGEEMLLLVAGYNGLDRVFALLLAAWCFWDVYAGMTKGRISMKFSTFKRAKSPLFFWVAFVFNLVAGIACLVLAIRGV